MSEPKVNPPLGAIMGRMGGYLLPAGAAASEMWNPAAVTSTAQGVLSDFKNRMVRRDAAPPEGFAQMLRGFDEIPGMPPNGDIGSLLHAESESYVNEIVRRSTNLVEFRARLGDLDVALPVPQPREFVCIVTEDIKRLYGVQAEFPAGVAGAAAQMLSVLPRPFVARLGDADDVMARPKAFIPVSRQCCLGLASINYFTLLYELHLWETRTTEDAFKADCMFYRTPARHLAMFPPHGVIFEEDVPQPPIGSQLPAESYGGLHMQRTGQRGPTATIIQKGRVTMYDYTNDHGTWEGNGVYLVARRFKYEAGKTYKFGLFADGSRGAPVSTGQYTIVIPRETDLIPVQYFVVHSADHRMAPSLPHCDWAPHVIDSKPDPAFPDDATKRIETRCYDGVSVALGCVVQHNQTTLTAPLSTKLPQTPATLNPPTHSISQVAKTYPTVIQLDMSASVCGT